MARRLRPAALLWGAFLGLPLAALLLRLRAPGQPAVLLVEGLGLLAGRSSRLARQLKVGTALALEVLLVSADNPAAFCAALEV